MVNGKPLIYGIHTWIRHGLLFNWFGPTATRPIWRDSGATDERHHGAPRWLAGWFPWLISQSKKWWWELGVASWLRESSDNFGHPIPPPTTETMLQSICFPDDWDHNYVVFFSYERGMGFRFLFPLTEVSLPPLGHFFWQQRETRLVARNLGYKTSLSDGQLTISVESSTSALSKTREGGQMRGLPTSLW